VLLIAVIVVAVLVVRRGSSRASITSGSRRSSDSHNGLVRASSSSFVAEFANPTCMLHLQRLAIVSDPSPDAGPATTDVDAMDANVPRPSTHNDDDDV
jgi:hypothetical protein